jgi:hypothetical protein
MTAGGLRQITLSVALKAAKSPQNIPKTIHHGNVVMAITAIRVPGVYGGGWISHPALAPSSA